MLVPLLAARNAQLLYEATFCVWCLSLSPPLCPVLERAGAAAAAARLVRDTMPPKVVRMAAATLANLARSPACGESAVADIAESHLPAALDALAAADFAAADPELVREAVGLHSRPPLHAPPFSSCCRLSTLQSDDLRTLRDALRTSRRRLTSLERYERELATRRLDWTAVHGPEFWRENAAGFEATEFRALASLRELLEDPGTDETTAAVALSDLGEFAVAHPQGRAILAHLGVRPVVMGFLRREEDLLRQQALLACSKMMVTRWQHVGGFTTAAGGAGGGDAGGTPKPQAAAGAAK